MQTYIFYLEYITLVCFDQFKQPRRKLDGAVDIPYDLNNLSTFGQVEEEILSQNLPTEWGKIELGLIYYRKTSTAKADHYDLKSKGAIMAFISECKRKRNVQLCIYFTNQSKRKEIVCGSSVIDDVDEESPSKKIRVYIWFILYNV